MTHAGKRVLLAECLLRRFAIRQFGHGQKKSQTSACLGGGGRHENVSILAGLSSEASPELAN
jgi:hypothetical protein